jgi:hypothetical protein
MSPNVTDSLAYKLARARVSNFALFGGLGSSWRENIRKHQEPRPPGAEPNPETLGRAAMLCHIDTENDEAIAKRLGISRRTLARWKRRPEFIAAETALRAQHWHVWTVQNPHYVLDDDE